MTLLPRLRSQWFACLGFCLAWASLTPTRAELSSASPLKVKVVVVTLFEVGEDTGDRPGEYQYWVEREHLTNRVAVPGAWRPVRYRDDGVVGICTGGGTARSAASITAMGLDPRFDCSKAYWVTAGIAGIDPADGTLGCAAWAENIVDGDLAYEIDAREIPSDWTTGYIPLSQQRPYALPKKTRGIGNVAFTLNKPFVEWAYQLTRDTPLMENDVMKVNRARYTNHPAALRAPFVLKGDNLAGSTFWHGKLLNQWANDWVKYWTDGTGNYVTTAMEDSGTLQALTFLSAAGKADTNRVLVLRTASNFDQQPPGKTAAESLAEENDGKYSAYIPSLEAAYRVGSKVVHALVDRWSEYGVTIPTAKSGSP
jgi:purine nucleoside permease